MPVTRFSRQREAILQALQARCDHPTAEMLYLTLRQTHPNISLGTVYRNLTLLEGQGEAQRIRSQEGPDRYDGGMEPHDHLYCRKCGAVVDLPSMEAALDAQKIQTAARKYDVVVEAHQISFYGVCAACAADTQ